MSEETERLKAELALAEACEVLEAAREAFHAKRTPARVKRFKAESQKVAELRQAFRLAYPTKPVAEGDAVAAIGTVDGASEVKIR